MVERPVVWQANKRNITDKDGKVVGQSLWLSWQCGRFQHQRSAVRIQSLANNYIGHLFTIDCIEKTKIKGKYHCTADFQFDWFGLSGFTNFVPKINADLLEWLKLKVHERLLRPNCEQSME